LRHPGLSKHYPIIAREGWVYIAAACAGGLLVHWILGFLWTIPIWFVLIFLLQFFRDPVSQIPSQVGAVVSPANGRVVKIEETYDPFCGRQAIKISIFMNLFSVHSNRAPVGGVVNKKWYRAGKYFNAALDKSSERNERNAICINTSDGYDVVSVQIAGFVARRILCYVKEGQQIDRGDRYGFIKFGSRLEVYLPVSSRIEVRLGRWVKSGSDIIGYLPQVT
jgi:phosphatidylserine decarboxylase